MSHYDRIDFSHAPPEQKHLAGRALDILAEATDDREIIVLNRSGRFVVSADCPHCALVGLIEHVLSGDVEEKMEFDIALTVLTQQFSDRLIDSEEAPND